MRGREDAYDLVIGADGARSTVRATVAPEHPDARYAGVLLWRTLVEETAMPPSVALPADDEPSREMYAGPYRLVTYLVPGPAGETTVGHRRLNLVWNDPGQRETLHAAEPSTARRFAAASRPARCRTRVRGRLAAFASASWPSPWREALALALKAGAVFGTPIVHYRPSRLVNGRVALAGDAAHAASPMVGGGFRQGLYDVQALSQTMSAITAPGDVTRRARPLPAAATGPGRGPRIRQRASHRCLPGPSGR